VRRLLRLAVRGSNVSPADDSGLGVPPDLDLLAQRVPRAWRIWWLGCGPGWFPLLARLGADLDDIAPSWSLSQAKNKFGELRFYAEPGSDDPVVRQRFADRIRLAEADAARTCEECGRPGSLGRTPSGWLATLCTNCQEAARDDS
jgi:hypothetical protein